jgi:hypothetical protein
MGLEDFSEGTTWLKAVDIKQPFTARLVEASMQPSNFGGKQLVLDFGKFKYSLSKGNPNIKRLMAGMGNDEELWIHRDVNFSLQDYVDRDGNPAKGILCEVAPQVAAGDPPSPSESMDSSKADSDLPWDK